MGVHGLWQILEPTAQPVNLDSLEGRRLAVDISLWLYQAAHGFNAHGNDTRAPHIVLLLNRIAKLLYFKVRPVFVFDGQDIPEYKQHVLRERQLNRDLDELNVKKQLKRVLKDAEKDGPSLIDDVFNVTDEPLRAKPKKNHYTVDNDELLSGYHELVNRDDKIAFLADVKQKMKTKKLNDEDIPENPDDFAKFQRQRILQRVKINDEIESLRNDKIRQLAQTNNEGNVKLTIDSHSRGHLLTQTANYDTDKEKPKRITDWNEFVKQVRQKYYHDDDVTQNKKEEELKTLDINESDDDVTETFQIISTEKQSSSNVDRDNKDVGYTKSTVIENFVEKFNRKRPSLSDESSDHDSDFEVVLLDESDMNPSSHNSYKEPEVIQIDSDTNDVSNDDSNIPPLKAVDNTVEAELQNHGVYAECQELLTYLGLPYIVAPGEAEAQCAELEQLGLVEGIITEDSDVWLFGGKKVYKNMFSRKKNVHYYDGNFIKQKLGLSRYDFVVLTMLAGGDYTRGLEKVGIVTALELFAEFTVKNEENPENAFKTLEMIKNWLDSKDEFIEKYGKNKHFIESTKRIKLRKLIENSNDKESLETFPNKGIFNAYCIPKVNKNKENFKWNPINFIELEHFLWNTIGWTIRDLHAKTHNSYKIWNEFVSKKLQSYQLRITGYQHKVSLDNDLKLAPTKRVDIALKKLFKSRGNPEDLIKNKIENQRKHKNPMCIDKKNDDYDSFSDDNVDFSFFSNEPNSSKALNGAVNHTKKNFNLKPSELNLSEEDSSDDES